MAQVASLFVKISTSTKEFVAGIKSVAGGLSDLSTRATPAAQALAGAFAALNVGDALQKSVDRLSNIADASSAMGITAEAFQRLAFAASQGGASMAVVEQAMARMATNVNKWKELPIPLQGLGLELGKLQEMTPDQLFITMAEAIRGIKDPLDQISAANAAFGTRAAKELLPAVKAGFVEVGAQATVASNETVAAADRTGDAWAALQLKLDNMKAASLIPFADWFTSTMPTAVQTFVGALMGLAPSLEGLALAVIALGGPAGAWAALTGVLGTVATFFTTTLPAAFTATLAFLGPVGLIAVAVLALGAIWYKWGDQIKVIVVDVYTAIKTWLVDKFNAVVENIKQKIDAVTGFFKGMYTAVVGGSYVPDMMRGIQSEFGKLQSIMTDPVGYATSQVIGHFGRMASTVGKQIGDWIGGMSAQLGSLMGGPLGGLISGGIGGLIGAGIGALGGLFSGGEEAKKVNPARDLFLAGFGGAGTGEGSGFHNLATTLSRLTGEAGGGSMFRALTSADTMEKFNLAVKMIESLLSRTRTFGSGGLVTQPTFAVLGEGGPEMVTPLGSMATAGGPSIVVNISAPYASEPQWIREVVTKAVLRAIGDNHRGAYSDFETLVSEGRRAVSTQDWRPRAR